jgi:hypothetical protein
MEGVERLAQLVGILRERLGQIRTEQLGEAHRVLL